VEAADEAAEEMLCPSCGSSFRLAADATTDWHPRDGQGKLGKFDLLDFVGLGAFGTVYKARDPEDRVVAVKVPRSGNLSSRADLDRFEREARSVARLRHPAIVPVHEVGHQDGIPYLVCEFVQGVTLADRLSARPLAPSEAAQLLAAVSDALQYAHDLGVVHRDVKPSNIMLDEQSTPRLMDFGLAKRDAGDATMTLEGQVLGTPAYMSPEQARGEAHQVDGRSDVYSLGVILYQLLTGEPPLRGTTRMLLHQVLHDDSRRPRSLNDHIPRDLETICLKAMAKEPARRYLSARALADDLRRYLQGEPILARPVGRVEKLWRWCRRNPTVAGLTAAVFLLLVLVAVVATAGYVQTTFALSREAEQRTAAERERAEARHQEEIALAAEEKTRKEADNTSHHLYIANMNLAQRDWENRNLGRLRKCWRRPGTTRTAASSGPTGSGCATST
jgi:tRNA A-37 threonylcarbamoyl transferase component Bud32